jgi:hypothetical protein
MPFKLNRVFADPRQPAETGRVGPEYARRYAAQARFLADRVVETVGAIVTRSPEPPIVVVQGDHGPYGFSPDPHRPRPAILNAYSVPEPGRRALYPAISPVNSLRVVLAQALGEVQPLLADHVYRARPGIRERYERLDRDPSESASEPVLGGGEGAR